MEKRIKRVVRDVINENLYGDTLAERERYLASKLRHCSNVNEDVMSIYCGITSNGCKPMLLEKITINRILAKHGNNGFIVISANRADKPHDENVKNTKELRNRIAKQGYSYLPVYGGYRNTQTGEEADYEPSFLVFNYNENGESRDMKKLVELTKLWCGDYEQDCAYVKLPDKDPVYIDRNGKITNKRESDKVAINDPTKEFFTSLTDKHPLPGEKPVRRFSSDIEFPDFDAGEVAPERYIDNFENIHEWYCNPIPVTLNEKRRRMAMHEIMLW